MININDNNFRSNYFKKIQLSPTRKNKTKFFSKRNTEQKRKNHLNDNNIKIRNLTKYYNSKNNTAITNSNNDYIKRKSFKGKIVSLKGYKNKFGLKPIDKKKINLIINNFKKHKVVTERLLNKEKFLALNSVNNSNYTFLIRDEKNTRNKKRKLIYRNSDDDFCSHMINKFNNKTFGILDPPYIAPIYSTNLYYFRHQLINNFTEYNENIDYHRKKYNDAMKIGEINDEKNFKMALELEKKFYLNKYNIQNDNNDFKNSNENETKKIKGNIEPIKISNLRRNSMIIAPMIRGNIKNVMSPKKIEDKIDETNTNNLNNKIETSPRKRKSQEMNMNLYNNKMRFSISHLNEINNNKINNEENLSEFKKIHNSKEKKRIKQHSQDLINSINEISDYPYEELQSSYSRNKIGDLNLHNLSRAIKINIINKYLYNLEDDELLIHNPKKLKEEIKKVEIECNQNNYKMDYNFSFLRKKLRKETLIKFNYIKDSRFGYPV